jgi:hypothetical protein
MSRFFYCYDWKMAEYLKNNGHRFITHARHIKTNKEFFQYEFSDQLKRDIEKYINIKAC